jgi:hypothetical protein
MDLADPHMCSKNLLGSERRCAGRLKSDLVPDNSQILPPPEQRAKSATFTLAHLAAATPDSSPPFGRKKIDYLPLTFFEWQSAN